MGQQIIATISDPHFDYIAEDLGIELEEVIDEFISILKTIRYDYLLIGGDISNFADLTIKIMEKIQKDTSKPSYFIPGNHDLFKTYQDSEMFTSEDRYILLKNHEQSLLNKRIVLSDNYNIIGHIGWYDYSYVDETKYTYDELNNATMNGKTWGDKKYIDFELSDKELCKVFNDEIEILLKEASSEKIVLITHMINHPKFTREKEIAEEMSFFNAFLGSRNLFDLIKNYQIRYAICGHVHYRFSFSEGSTRYISNSLGYSKYWSYMSTDIPLTLRDQVLDSIYFIKI